MSLRSRLSGLLGARPPALQAGALCLRRGAAGPEVLLVTTLRTRRWIVPKGWPVPGRSLAEAAAQEAWEEAGATGHVAAAACGRYSYLKDRRPALDQPCEVHLFEITHVSLAADWPEAGRRAREWVPLAQAARQVGEPGLAALLAARAAGAQGGAQGGATPPAPAGQGAPRG